jgi:hypothetical protein
MRQRALRSDYQKSRNSQIKKLVFEGRKSLCEIGKMFPDKNGKPLSRQRIYQIAFYDSNR